MNTQPGSIDADDTPEYPLPSPTDSLSRDRRPPDDDDVGVEQLPSDNTERGDVEGVHDDANPVGGAVTGETT
ncbi:hypothetical protein RG836_03595 [Pseudomonas sp. SZMC_28357]|uniref:hypothetical protein n=1 Tax=Pseudomonas sp. SZMC_28357 TaxID=3074380 RepID=UPI002871EABB|nr:hypothetical protein [Pseudomonas sp. SZMC_28357]MDR9750517.1 hypothetical protein [Pseudomonas sp. SZMC_28357]